MKINSIQHNKISRLLFAPLGGIWESGCAAQFIYILGTASSSVVRFTLRPHYT